VKKTKKHLKIEIGGKQCVMPVLSATNQPLHDMIIGNNFQILYSPYTQAISHNIHNKWYSFPIEKLNKAYTHQKIEFIRN